MRSAERRGRACAAVFLAVALGPGAVGNAEETTAPVDDPGAVTDEASVEPAPRSVIAALVDDLSPETLKAKVEEFYDSAAVLEDPFGRYEQRRNIERHLQALLSGTKSVAFEVRAEFQSGDETVALWTVSVSHDSLSRDEPVVVEGVTHARFVNGKIAEQRDYYDVGGLVYEHVTLVGALVRWVKAKVAGD